MTKKSRLKSNPTDKPRLRPVLAIDTRLDELRKLERLKTDEILDREKIGETANETAEISIDLDAAAFAMLTGVAAAKVDQQALRSPLSALYRERDVIKRAITIGELMSLEQHGERIRAEVSARMDEWRALIRETALAVLELQRLNRERNEFCRDLRGPGGPPNLPCSGFALLGSGTIVGDEVYRFVESVITSGIMTRSEIAETSGD